MFLKALFLIPVCNAHDTTLHDHSLLLLEAFNIGKEIQAN